MWGQIGRVFNPPLVANLPHRYSRLREEFLGAHHAFRDGHTVRALDGTGRALVASHGLVLGRHALEVLPAEGELAIAVRVHDEAHHVSHR